MSDKCNKQNEEATTSKEANNNIVRKEKSNRQSNLQYIRQLKLNEVGSPPSKKLLRLAPYSKCQVRIRLP